IPWGRSPCWLPWRSACAPCFASGGNDPHEILSDSAGGDPVPHAAHAALLTVPCLARAQLPGRRVRGWIGGGFRVRAVRALGRRGSEPSGAEGRSFDAAQRRVGGRAPERSSWSP